MYPITVGGIKLLEALSLAGVVSYKAETLISVVREEKKAEIRLDAVLANSNNDIWLQPTILYRSQANLSHCTRGC